jgi:predicted nucleotide-binding protein (sugar kinase/HSP70/actin superfamily)
VLTLPLDGLPLTDIDITDRVHNMFWHSGQRILAAARIIRDDPRLEAVYLTHFACGPDSFLLSFFRETMKDKPFLELELDDHSGEAGLLTRLEAFFESRQRTVNSGQRAGAGGAPHSSRPTPKSPISNVYIPNVCDPAHVLAAAMRAHGLRAEVLPPSTSETLALGRALCLGRECLPCHTIAGDMVQRARQPGFEPGRAAYLIPTSAGPCRLGQFHDLLRQVLRRQGLGELRIVAPSAENGYQYGGLGVPPLRVGRLAWQGLVALDFLEKLRLHHRPYEREAGSADALYALLLRRLVEAVEAGGGRRIPALLDEAARRFAALAVDRGRARPIIGLVGEIYLRLNPFTNQQIVRRVEALGGEVWLAPMSEWLYYANHFSRFSAAAEHRYGNLLRLHLIRRVLDYDERRLLAPVAGCLPNAHEPPTAKLLAAAAPYFHPVLRTEAPLTVGKAVDFARQGLDGILNVMPFTCMPGTVVAGLAGRIHTDCDGIPWLDVSFDGLGETNQQTRLEAFLHQAEQFRRRKEAAP